MLLRTSATSSHLSAEFSIESITSLIIRHCDIFVCSQKFRMFLNTSCLMSSTSSSIVSILLASSSTSLGSDVSFSAAFFMSNVASCTLFAIVNNLFRISCGMFPMFSSVSLLLHALAYAAMSSDVSTSLIRSSLSIGWKNSLDNSESILRLISSASFSYLNTSAHSFSTLFLSFCMNASIIFLACSVTLIILSTCCM